MAKTNVDPSRSIAICEYTQNVEEYCKAPRNLEEHESSIDPPGRLFWIDMRDSYLCCSANEASINTYSVAVGTYAFLLACLLVLEAWLLPRSSSANPVVYRVVSSCRPSYDLVLVRQWKGLRCLGGQVLTRCAPRALVLDILLYHSALEIRQRARDFCLDFYASCPECCLYSW